MSKNDTTRTQEPTKQPLKVQVSVALPWTLIIIAAVALATFITGWNLRSEQITMSDVQWSVAQQLKEQTAKK